MSLAGCILQEPTCRAAMLCSSAPWPLTRSLLETMLGRLAQVQAQQRGEQNVTSSPHLSPQGTRAAVFASQPHLAAVSARLTTPILRSAVILQSTMISPRPAECSGRTLPRPGSLQMSWRAARQPTRLASARCRSAKQTCCRCAKPCSAHPILKPRPLPRPSCRCVLPALVEWSKPPTESVAHANRLGHVRLKVALSTSHIALPCVSQQAVMTTCPNHAATSSTDAST